MFTCCLLQCNIRIKYVWCQRTQSILCQQSTVQGQINADFNSEYLIFVYKLNEYAITLK